MLCPAESAAPWEDADGARDAPGAAELRLRAREAEIARRLAAVRDVKAPAPLGLPRGASVEFCAVLPSASSSVDASASDAPSVAAAADDSQSMAVDDD